MLMQGEHFRRDQAHTFDIVHLRTVLRLQLCINHYIVTHLYVYHLCSFLHHYTTSVGSTFFVQAVLQLSWLSIVSLFSTAISKGAYLDLLRRTLPYRRIMNSGRIIRIERPPRRDDPGPRPSRVKREWPNNLKGSGRVSEDVEPDQNIILTGIPRQGSSAPTR
jgi:hypothetical protein